MIITSGEAISHGCTLLRNIVLARLLTPQDFGIATLLGMSVSVVEFGGRLVVEQWVVQAKDADTPHYLAVAHFVRVALGLGSAILLLLLSWPLAWLFGIVEATWAMQVLALVPLLRGVAHLDVYTATKQLRFARLVAVDVLPQIAITAAAWPVVLAWPSFATQVWLLLTKEAVGACVSHIVARTPYRVSFDAHVRTSIVDFAWPLMANGVLMFLITQGDRLAVGVQYSVSDLALYAAAGSLALLPAATVLKVVGAIMLPHLAAAQQDAGEFCRRVSHASQLLSLLGGMYGVAMVLAGSAVVTLVFGERYFGSGALVGWLGFAQAIRLFRGLPTISAMAKGDTRSLLHSNVFRGSGVALAFLMAYRGASLAALASCAVLAEGVALAWGLWRFSTLHSVPIASYVYPMILNCAFIGMSVAIASISTPESAGASQVAIATVLLPGLVALHFLAFGESRRVLLSSVRSAFSW